MTGLAEGMTHYDAAVGGLGGCPFAAGATGNICTEDLVYLLQESGFETGVDIFQDTAGGVFTDDMIDGYMALKQEDIERLNMTTHPVEFDLYYSV